MTRIQVKKYKKKHWGRHNHYWEYDSRSYYVYLPKEVAEKVLGKDLKIFFEVAPEERIILSVKNSSTVDKEPRKDRSTVEK